MIGVIDYHSGSLTSQASQLFNPFISTYTNLIGTDFPNHNQIRILGELFAH